MRIIIAERFTAEAARLASLVVPLDAVPPADRAGLLVLLRWPLGGEARALRPEPGSADAVALRFEPFDNPAGELMQLCIAAGPGSTDAEGDAARAWVRADRLDPWTRPPISLAGAGADDPVRCLHVVERFWCDRDGAFLEGWVHAYEDRITRFMVRSSVAAYAVTELLPRPDVLTHYAAFPHAGRSGFKVYVPWQPGEPVELEVETARGAQRFAAVLPEGALPRRAWSCNHPVAWEIPGEPSSGELAGQRLFELANRPGQVVVEVGARVVSPHAVPMRDLFPLAARFIGVDIHPSPTVDVVGDAHRLHELVGEAAADAVFSYSVLEHLACPWLFAAAVNRALRPGGITFHTTHQTWPLHEEPNDFWRFSDAALRVLFGAGAGFEVLDAGMGELMSIHPDERKPGVEYTPLCSAFATSYVLARKVRELAPGEVAWPLEAAEGEAVARQYPLRE